MNNHVHAFHIRPIPASMNFEISTVGKHIKIIRCYELGYVLFLLSFRVSIVISSGM